MSNSGVNSAKHYNFYQTQLRETYKKAAKSQNDSHYEMIKAKGKKYLGSDKVFCEIGFGAGLMLRYAFKHFGKVYGLDISPENIELTRNELENEGYKNFELYTTDLKTFDQKFENKFDVISFIHGLEHFSDDDYPVVLSNIKKYLKPGGVFTGALPHKLPYNYSMCPNCEHIYEINGHFSIHDMNTLSELFTQNGFEIIHLNTFNFMHLLKYRNLAKRVYNFIYYGLLGNRPFFQLEYIVKPIY